jgi:hypothetical protein
VIGAAQLIKRRSFLKVDSDIVVLGGFYILVALVFLFFEEFVINYRPVLINGFLEASYPSSTTLLALCVISTIREVLGNASFAGIPIPFLENYKIAFLVKAPGGMVVYGLVIALVYVITSGKAPKKKDFSCAGCPNAGNCHTGSCTGTNENNVNNEAEKGGAQ